MALWGTLRQRIGGSVPSDADEFVDDFFKKTQADEKWHLPQLKTQVNVFVEQQMKDRRRGIALVTSGATIVPLDAGYESFVDLSSRVQEYQGPACVEFLLHLGYAVIFLHREDSLEPFTRHFQKYIKNRAFMNMLQMRGDGELVLEGLDDGQKSRFLNIVSLYNDTKHRLLSLPFTSVQQYLMLLRMASQAIHGAKSRGIVILAATVMDFYVPVKEDKLWRRKKGEFSVNFVRVPNLIRKIRKEWCPKAFLVTFRNQLDFNEMVEAAHTDLEKWGVDVVAGTNRWEYPHQILLVSEQEETIISSPEDEDINDAFASSIADMHRNFRRKRDILERGKQLLLLSAKFSMLKEKDLVNEDADGNKNVKFGKGLKIRADRRIGSKSPVYELKNIFQNKSHCARAHVWEGQIEHPTGESALDVVIAFSPAGNPETIRDVWGDFWSGWAEKEISEFKEQISSVSLSSAIDVVTTTISGDYSSASAILQYMWSKIGSAWTDGEQTRIRQSIQNMIAIGLNRGLIEPKGLSSLEELLDHPRLQRFDSLILDQPPISVNSQTRRRRRDSDEDDEADPARLERARKVRVHRAVNEYMDDMFEEGLLDSIIDYVQHGAAVHVTGYSMGGMLGQLFMLHLGDRIRMQGLDASKISFVGFGSPRVGDQGFAARLRLLFEPEQLLIVMHPSDTVHAFPPTTEGYADGCIKIFLKEDGLGVGRRTASSFSLLPMIKSADRVLESAFKARWVSGNADQKCDFCGRVEHLTEQHRCRYCTERGSHRGVDCPNKDKPCSLCGNAKHCTGEHRCKVCQQYGHRGRECHVQRDVGITELVTYFRFHHFLYYNSNLKTSVAFTSG